MATSAVEQGYVLLTAARDEAPYIRRTIDSVRHQTVEPALWVVVDDGSSDNTLDIIRSAAADLPYVKVVERGAPGSSRDFASKASALRAAWDAVDAEGFAFIGILDADVELPVDFFARMIANFREDPVLGLVGGWIWEPDGGTFRPRATNRSCSVHGGSQLYRRACYERIGGIQPLPAGGEDTFAEVSAEMYGWTVRSDERVSVKHLKPAGHAAGSRLRSGYQEGVRAWALGYHPLYMLARSFRRLTERPIVLRATCALTGYFGCALKRTPRAAPEDFVKFLRRRQMQKLMPWMPPPDSGRTGPR